MARFIDSIAALRRRNFDHSRSPRRRGALSLSDDPSRRIRTQVPALVDRLEDRILLHHNLSFVTPATALDISEQSEQIYSVRVVNSNNNNVINDATIQWSIIGEGGPTWANSQTIGGGINGQYTNTLNLGSVTGSFTLQVSIVHDSSQHQDSDQTIVTISQSITISDQTITFNELTDKTYGDAPFEVFATASSNLPVSFSIVAGPATIDGNLVTITGAGTVTVRASQGGNESFNAAPDVDQSFEVAKAQLTVSAADVSKTYGEEITVEGSFIGLVNGDDISYTFASAGAVASASVADSPYDITATLVDPDGRIGNYEVSFNLGSVTVNAAKLTVTANDQSKVYDGTPFTDFTVSYNGFVNGEDESVLDGTPIFGGDSQGAIDAGTYEITVGGLTSGNYEIEFQPGTLTIQQAQLSGDDVTVDVVQSTLNLTQMNGHITFAITVNHENSTLFNVAFLNQVEILGQMYSLDDVGAANWQVDPVTNTLFLKLRMDQIREDLIAAATGEEADLDQWVKQGQSAVNDFDIEVTGHADNFIVTGFDEVRLLVTKKFLESLGIDV